MAKTPKSFIREILKVTENPSIISFAGGLPNPALIDVEGISRAAATVLSRMAEPCSSIQQQKDTCRSGSSLQTATKNVLVYRSLPMKS